jgi:hypothetical protein
LPVLVGPGPDKSRVSGSTTAKAGAIVCLPTRGQRSRPDDRRPALSFVENLEDGFRSVGRITGGLARENAELRELLFLAVTELALRTAGREGLVPNGTPPGGTAAETKGRGKGSAPFGTLASVRASIRREGQLLRAFQPDAAPTARLRYGGNGLRRG